MRDRDLSSEGIIGTIMRELVVDPDEGVVQLFGQRFCLVTPGLMASLLKELEAIMGTSARAPIYMAGENAARASAAFFEEVTARGEIASVEEAIPGHLSKVCSAYGHGHFEVESADFPEGRMTFTVKNSLIVEGYGPSDKPVCHFYAGYAAGVIKALLDKDVHCEEVACSAMGADRCRFQIAPLEYFSPLLPRPAKRRL